MNSAKVQNGVSLRLQSRESKGARYLAVALCFWFPRSLSGELVQAILIKRYDASCRLREVFTIQVRQMEPSLSVFNRLNCSRCRDGSSIPFLSTGRAIARDVHGAQQTWQHHMREQE